MPPWPPPPTSLWPSTLTLALIPSHVATCHPPRRARPTTCASISTTSEPPSETTSSFPPSPGTDPLGVGAFALPHRRPLNQRTSQSAKSPPAHHEYSREPAGGIT